MQFSSSEQELTRVYGAPSTFYVQEFSEEKTANEILGEINKQMHFRNVYP